MFQNEYLLCCQVVADYIKSEPEDTYQNSECKTTTKEENVYANTWLCLHVQQPNKEMSCWKRYLVFRFSRVLVLIVILQFNSLLYSKRQNVKFKINIISILKRIDSMMCKFYNSYSIFLFTYICSNCNYVILQLFKIVYIAW